MTLKSESEAILCTGKFRRNSCPVGEIYRMVELKVSFEVYLVQTIPLDEENEEVK